MLIDSHTHLYVEAFEDDLDDVIQKSINRGITKFFLPSIDSSYTQKMFDLEKKYPENIYLMMGLHPTSVKPETFEEELNLVKKHLNNRKFAAVGEIGIDLYWDKTHLKEQQFAFKTQIKWAKEMKLPIVIHSRESFDEIFEVLDSEKDENLRGIFHCFTGTKQQAEKAISYNMKLGIGGVVTFKNGKIDKFLNEIPIENIVLETDSPYLAPAPFRGKRNEPLYLEYVVQKLTEIYSLSAEEISKITSRNTLEVFSKYTKNN